MGPTWPPSFSPRSRPTSSRSRRPRRSPLSTLPSSGRPSRSWRRLRSAPSLLPLSKPHQTGIRISVEIRRKSDTLEPIHYPNCEDAEVAKKKTPVTSKYNTVLPKPCWLSLLVSSSTSQGSAQPTSLLISVSSPTINLEHQKKKKNATLSRLEISRMLNRGQLRGCSL